MKKFSAKRSKVTVEVPDCEGQVDELFDGQEYIEEGEAIVKNLRPFVETAAATQRIEAEKNGGFAKTVSVLGTRGNVTFTFGNRFSKISDHDAEVIQAEVGDTVFAELFAKKETVSVRPEALQDLLAILGKDADAYLERTEETVPVKDFREKRFEIRPTVSDEVNEKLDLIVAKFASKATMKFKPQT